MTLNEIIRNALLPICNDVVPDAYIGGSDIYIVFNYSTHGDNYADDEPCHEVCLIQAHLYCPTSFDSVQMIADIKNALHSAGFTWPSVTPASDEDGQHIVFECESARGVESNR